MFNAINFSKNKLKKTKLKLLIRVALISAILCLFYIRFLLLATPHEQYVVNTLNENSILTSSLRRKILTVDSFNNPSYHQRENCSRPAILDFPSDGLTRRQRQQGWLLIHIVLMFYGFWFMASICDDYLVPSIEQICTNFNIEHDVIGATVMAAAVASPELFMNCIGTFVTEGDIGVGTIVGSAIFNVLAVPACCGLFVVNYLKLDWWPITRDCLMYLLAVLSLLVILKDGQVWWYEALGLILAYFIYMLVMYYNKKISHLVKNLLRSWGLYTPQYTEVNEFTALLDRGQNNASQFSVALGDCTNLEQALNTSHIMLYMEQQERQESIASPWSCQNQAFVEFLFRWPITFLLWLTIPNSRKHKSLKYLTFILAIIWIAGISYIVAFVTTVIGDTLNIPDAVMGLTILAVGISIPEAVCSILVTRQGQGCMGISNSLGSNTFDILLSLGLPWFIKAFFLPEIDGQKFLPLNSASLTFAGILLLTSLLALYLLLVWNKFRLDWRVGVSCLIMYLGFMLLATLIELNVFFPVNLPKCRL